MIDEPLRPRVTTFPFDRSAGDERGARGDSAVTFLSLDADGTVRFVDDSWTRLTDYDREMIVGRPFASVLTDDSGERFEMLLADLDPEHSPGNYRFSAATDGRSPSFWRDNPRRDRTGR